MKYRESSMPAQDYWESLLHVESILDSFSITPDLGEVAELGCGYGTFTLPVARRTGCIVHAVDIDPEMVAATTKRAVEAGLATVDCSLRDVAVNGFGLPDASCGACLLFNILHGEDPVSMLREAARVVRPGGLIAVIHWRDDVETPRGPRMEIRPSPEQIMDWAAEVGVVKLRGKAFLIPPWHFGMALTRL